MNKTNYVSIAIPFYNAESTLLDAIRSVFAQTHEQWELILIDDGSTDLSLSIAKSIDDPRVRVFSDGKNLKLAARLNQIVELASYDFIARMDADDLMSPHRIEKLLNILLENSTYDLASCGTFSIRDDNSLLGFRGKFENNYTFNGLLEKSQGFLHAGLIARKSWYQRNKYNERIPVGQDTELWLRAAKANDFKAISIEEPLYMYREEGNVTINKLLKAYSVERKEYIRLIDNPLRKLTYLNKSYAKTILVKVMEATDTLRYLLARRNKDVINKNLIQNFRQDIQAIFNTKVPGVE